MCAVAVHQQQTGLAAFAPGQGFKARAGDLVKAGFWFGFEGFTEPGWAAVAALRARREVRRHGIRSWVS